jgi:hypothetical protein
MSARRRSPDGALVEEVRAKTTRLRAAKEAFNSLVREVDLELEQKLNGIDEETVHVPLTLAQTCIRAITEKRGLIPTVIDELRQILEFRSISGDSGTDEQAPVTSLSRVSIAPAGEQENEEEEEGPGLSGTRGLPDLDAIDLDDEEFIKQHEPQDELDIASDIEFP